ncbi:MAG: hypothetical protein ACUVT4_12070, partial [Actinomycetota bacterium]
VDAAETPPLTEGNHPQWRYTGHVFSAEKPPDLEIMKPKAHLRRYWPRKPVPTKASARRPGQDILPVLPIGIQ